MYLTAFRRLQRKFLPERFCFLDLDRYSWEDTGHYVLQQLSLVGSLHLRQILIWWIIFIFIFIFFPQIYYFPNLRYLQQLRGNYYTSNNN